LHGRLLFLHHQAAGSLVSVVLVSENVHHCVFHHPPSTERTSRMAAANEARSTDRQLKTYKGSCFCGAVKFTVTGEPAAMGYCHCESCRSWSAGPVNAFRSEEHTSELQSRFDLVCRLLLEKKKKNHSKTSYEPHRHP